MTDESRTSQWAMLHSIIAGYETGGERVAAARLAYFRIAEPGKADNFHDLIHRLYLASEQRWPSVALVYSRVGASWREIERLAGIIEDEFHGKMVAVSKGERQ